MPVWIKRSMIALNGAIAVLTGILTLAGLADASMWALLVAVVPAVAIANIYIINKAATLLSGEEWWKSRIRVLELQQQAADMERELQASTQAQRPPQGALPPPHNATVE